MKLSLIFLFLFCLLLDLHAQDIVWERDQPGIFHGAGPCLVKNFRANAIYEIINRIQPLTKPKGFDVLENINVSLVNKVYQGALLTAFPKYYRYQKGPIQKQGEYCVHRIAINNPAVLMNSQSDLFANETDQLGLPGMFTDTFKVAYKEINGYPVGYAISSFANSGTRIFILNPKRKAVFLPVTKEQYLRFWIGKLKNEVEEGKKKDLETSESIRMMSANADLKNTVSEMQKIQHGMQAWQRFLEEKIKTYTQRLAALSPEEKKAPAYYSLPKDVAMMQEKGGNYKEEIHGHLPYEPDEGAEAFEVKPLFRYNPDFFDRSLPNTAFQLIVFLDCYSEDFKDEVKTFLDEEVYPKINYREIAALMYK